ncbi:MAG: Conjugal transfer protein [Burkholderiales bacterium]|jgi:type IV secretion system protein VirB5|nr:Conjugal transfer protein [Burkholderiales bacterium]
MPDNLNSSKLLTRENPYFNEIKGYMDLRTADKISRSMGWFFGVFGLTIALICSCGMIYIGSKSKYIPMVYMADAHGGLTYSGVATDVLKITQPMLANQLKDYIVDLRQIPQDTELKSQYMRKVKMMSTAELFTNSIIPTVKDRYIANTGKTVKVTIKNVLPISKNTWQVDWEEQSGDLPADKFKGTITFTLNQNIEDPAVLLYDPLGIVVSDININQEVSQ